MRSSENTVVRLPLDCGGYKYVSGNPFGDTANSNIQIKMYITSLNLNTYLYI